MHPYDRHAARQRSSIARQEAVLNAIVGYRFLAPHKIAADELREREMARAALSPIHIGSSAASVRSSLFTSLRHRLGAMSIATGTRLQRGAVVSLDPTSGT